VQSGKNKGEMTVARMTTMLMLAMLAWCGPFRGKNHRELAMDWLKTRM
jgi:hypothetical protein